MSRRPVAGLGLAWLVAFAAAFLAGCGPDSLEEGGPPGDTTAVRQGVPDTVTPVPPDTVQPAPPDTVQPAPPDTLQLGPPDTARAALPDTLPVPPDTASTSRAARPAADPTAFYRSGTVRVLVLFAKLRGTPDPVNLDALKDRDGRAGESARDLLNPEHPGSLAHFYDEMSYGQLRLRTPSGGELDTLQWYETARAEASAYPGSGWSKLRSFALEALQSVDHSEGRRFDFGDYDGDGDGRVDLLLLYFPRAFGDASGFNGTITNLHYESDDGVAVDKAILAEMRPSFPYLVATAAHEYGHIMGLPELFDRTHFLQRSSPPLEHSAGIGTWGLMGRGAPGWVHVPGSEDGPNPLTVWSRLHVGWINRDNGRLVDVAEALEDVPILDVNVDGGRTYRLRRPGSDTEYFLVANRQNTYSETGVGSYYDDHAPASGLIIWHVDEGAGGGNDANIDESHKRVDLECADGLYADGGYPGDEPDPVAGGDNLDFWSTDGTYARAHHGNLGDATDLWTGDSQVAFGPDTDPSSNAYDGDRQDVVTDIRVSGIRALPAGVMEADLSPGTSPQP